MPQLPERTMTITEVAEHLQCSHDTVRREISRGNLRAVKFGRSIRIRPDDLRKSLRPVTRLGGDAA